MATVQPEWRAPPEPAGPVREKLPKLRIYNSLTRSKTLFVPLDAGGRKVGWYACGPTVYDDAHLGHARNYVSTDIIRRIMQDYFKFDLTFVMNITDVDDKIILAARQQYLLQQWKARHTEVDHDVQDVTTKALSAYLEKNLPLLGPAISAESYDEQAAQAYGHVLQGQSLAKDGTPPGDKEAKVKMHLKTAASASQALRMPAPSLDNFVKEAAGILSPYIDSLEKHTISGRDHDIFTMLTKHYEQRFFEDMKALNVRYPDKLTRVTEYGPQIIDFVKQIEKHGFGYEHEGSIYYDTQAWESTGGVYARLEPWNRNDKELQADGEGSLTEKKTGFKRSGADFALWKASKQGEPSWSSPWGEGRPGWHIECSAMASDVLGKHMDIHSGGIDLAFPHHDNELAQSEAYWATSGKDSEQWVNYFLHMGHLSIQGSKMSKSLKNFTTIRDALAKGDWTPRSLRIVFLLGAWRDGLEITGEVVKAGKAWEEKLDNFFIKVRDVQQRGHPEPTNGVPNGMHDLKIDDHFHALVEGLDNAKAKFDEALCDSFDTPTAMRIISDLITAYNTDKRVPDVVSLGIGEWITSIVHMFGLDAAEHRIRSVGWSGLDIAEEAKPFVYPLAELRDRVREQAKAGQIDALALGMLGDKETRYADNQPYANANADFQRKVAELLSRNAPPKDYLAACDHVRDEVLWNLNIYLEDRENMPALVRPLSQSLREERDARESMAAGKAAEKARAKAEKDAADQARLKAAQVSPVDMFQTKEFSEWEKEGEYRGMPTKDAEGKELAKSRLKKLKKEYDRQKKLYSEQQPSV